MWAGNVHGHTDYCDGKGKPVEYIEFAIRKKHLLIGFSSHIPLMNHQSNWNMKKENFYRYINEINDLKVNFKGVIDVFCGFEMDDPYSLYTCSELRNLYEDMVDYTIGSVHYLGVLKNGELWEVDGSTEMFLSGVQEIFDGDLQKTIMHYFKRMREILLESRPDILGHLDKIMIHQSLRDFVNKNEQLYLDEVNSVLDICAQLGIIVEINTRGLYTKRLNNFYPARTLWQFLKQKNIPIVVTSDCHHPEELDNYCTEVHQEAKLFGLNLIDIQEFLQM